MKPEFKNRFTWAMRLFKWALTALPFSILVFWCYIINPALSGYELVITIVIGLVMQYITRVSVTMGIIGKMMLEADGNDLNPSFKESFAKLMKKINEDYK